MRPQTHSAYLDVVGCAGFGGDLTGLLTGLVGWGFTICAMNADNGLIELTPFKQAIMFCAALHSNRMPLNDSSISAISCLHSACRKQVHHVSDFSINK
jgi:hypothetical protein